MNAYENAAKAISRGEAQGHALWVLLSDERARDGYWLKPMPWEGAGEYQHVSFVNGEHGFIHIPSTNKSLPTDWGKARS